MLFMKKINQSVFLFFIILSAAIYKPMSLILSNLDDSIYSLSQSAKSIKIEYFKGFNQSVYNNIIWKVDDINNKNIIFILERSPDQKVFSQIYLLNADSLRCKQPFNFRDENFPTGLIYYRLKMESPDGAISYTANISIFNKAIGFKIVSLTPNPVNSGMILLNFSADTSMKVAVQITDVSGANRKQVNYQLYAGNNQFKLDISRLKRGAYVLFAKTNNGIFKTEKFLKL